MKAISILLLLSVGCAFQPPDDHPLAGVWGAAAARLVVSPQGLVLELPCGSVETGPVTWAAGEFRAAGRSISRTGVRPDPAEGVPVAVTAPVSIRGHLQGEELILTVEPQPVPGTVATTYRLQRGEPDQMIVCG